jgi:uncharacterized protein (TIGR03435 family)
MIMKKLGAIAVACRLGVAFAQSPPAQPKATAPRFEVASIKPCADDGSPGSLCSGSPGRYSLSCASLTNLINLSYVIYANGMANFLGERLAPIERGPEWTRAERFTIEAKAEGTPSQGTMQGPMMRALLEDRFKLKIHSETREVPVYALTVAKGGAKLQAGRAGNCKSFGLRPSAGPAGARATPPGDLWASAHHNG